MVPSFNGRTAPALNGMPIMSETGPAGGLASWRRGGRPIGTGGTGIGATGASGSLGAGGSM
eukprot:4424291-Alexandrium_andersonii.AAC.1